MKDFLIDDNGDIDLSGGDMQITVSDYQHQEHLLVAQKGSIKQVPDVGVGIENYLNDAAIDDMVRMVRSEFEKDGMAVASVKYDEQNGQLNYDAQYNS